MNLIPKTKEEISEMRNAYAPLEAIINEFKNMDAYAVEIDGYTQSSAESCVASFKHACDRMNCGVTAKMIKGKPYLIKEGK